MDTRRCSRTGRSSRRRLRRGSAVAQQRAGSCEGGRGRSSSSERGTVWNDSTTSKVQRRAGAELQRRRSRSEKRSRAALTRRSRSCRCVFRPRLAEQSFVLGQVSMDCARGYRTAAVRLWESLAIDRRVCGGSGEHRFCATLLFQSAFPARLALPLIGSSTAQRTTSRIQQHGRTRGEGRGGDALGVEWQ